MDKSLALWPIHYQPLPDELLSCWLVRLAHGHGLKVQTFCNAIFGNQRQVWNRDIDRLAPAWLVNEVQMRTGVTQKVALGTTLRPYEGLLYRKFNPSGFLPWLLSLKLFHRKRIGYGLQFCPACLAEDQIPYFRRRWRVAFNTVCTKHAIMLHDRCPKCQAAVAVHRLDICGFVVQSNRELSVCHACRFDLCKAPQTSPLIYDRKAAALLLHASRVLDVGATRRGKWQLPMFAVLHHVCAMLTARYEHMKLRQFVLAQLGVPDIFLTAGYVSLEMRPIEQRHHLLQLAGWMMVDLDGRLTAAWRAGTVRYNILRKDFVDPPDWYCQIAGRMANWRERHDSFNFLKTVLIPL